MDGLDLIYEAAFALDALSCGGNPGYAAMVSGMSALEALQEDPSSLEPGQLALFEAAHRLLDVATECDLPLDAGHRAQAAQCACGLFQVASSSRTWLVSSCQVRRRCDEGCWGRTKIS